MPNHHETTIENCLPQSPWVYFPQLSASFARMRPNMTPFREHLLDNFGPQTGEYIAVSSHHQRPETFDFRC